MRTIESKIQGKFESLLSAIRRRSFGLPLSPMLTKMKKKIVKIFNFQNVNKKNEWT